MLTVRKARPSDVDSIVPRLREADMAELTVAGRNPSVSLQLALEIGEGMVAVDEQDSPHVIWGVTPTGTPFMGSVWMVAADTIQDNWMQVLRETHKWVDAVAGNYHAIGNLVMKQNALHVRWLKWAGFTFLREVELEGHAYYEFAKTNRSTSNV